MAKGMNLVSSFFRSMKNLSKEVKQKEEKRCSETSRGFQEEEGPCSFYSRNEEPILQKAPKHYTFPFPFEEEDKIHGDGGHLEHEILSGYLVEYKSQPKDFKETLDS